MVHQPRHKANNLPPAPEGVNIIGVEGYYQPVSPFQKEPQTLAGMNDYEYDRFKKEHPELDQGALIVDAPRVVVNAFRNAKNRVAGVGTITVAKFKEALAPKPETRGRYRAGRPATQE